MKTKKLVDVTDEYSTFVLSENFNKYRENQIKIAGTVLSNNELLTILEEQAQMEINE